MNETMDGLVTPPDSDYADADHFAQALRPQHPTVIKTTPRGWEEADLLRALGAED